MLWRTSSQAPFRATTCQDMSTMLLITWSHYLLQNPLGVKDHMTMVFKPYWLWNNRMYGVLHNLCCLWNLSKGSNSCYLVFLVNFFQVLASFNKIILMIWFHHPFNKLIDLMLMNFDFFYNNIFKTIYKVCENETQWYLNERYMFWINSAFELIK
jgi:hypothetical protein